MTVETRRGDAIRHGDFLLVPISRSWSLRLPGLPGGLVWNRPVGLEVDHRGERLFLPVRDRTRRFQLFFLGSGTAAFLFTRAVLCRRRKSGGFFRRVLFGR